MNGRPTTIMTLKPGKTLLHFGFKFNAVATSRPVEKGMWRNQIFARY